MLTRCAFFLLSLHLLPTARFTLLFSRFISLYLDLSESSYDTGEVSSLLTARFALIPGYTITATPSQNSPVCSASFRVTGHVCCVTTVAPSPPYGTLLPLPLTVQKTVSMSSIVGSFLRRDEVLEGSIPVP